MRVGARELGLWLLIVAGCQGTIEAGDEARVAGTRPNAGGGDDPAGRDAPMGMGMMSAGMQPAAAGSGSAENPSGEPALDCAAAELEPGPAPLRLLTRAQYLNTVHELVGEVPGLADALGPTSEASAFGLVQPDVSQVELESFQAGADAIAKHVSGDAAALQRVAPCASGTPPETCARAMIERFGARAYRAALGDPEDIARHLQLFAAGASTSYAHGIELLLRGMLQAPRFLYHVELGSGEQAGANAVKLTAHELAARLSYLVWNSAPDAALLDAAARGELATAAGLAAQLTRMRGDARGGDLVARFLAGWLHVDALDGVVKDAALFPEWQAPGLRSALSAQAHAFFAHVLDAEQGRLGALLTTRTVLVNDALADFYGRRAGSAFEPLELPIGQASGVLTLPAVLARAAKPDESSPIYRGKLVREALLCQQLPAPPANIPKPPEVQPDVSTRERLRQHEVDPACSGCHQLLDPIGLGFEHFDALGRYRSEDGGDPVDARGEIVSSEDADGAFEGVSELGEKLAGSAEVEACVTKQWFRYALGRFEQDFDACTVQRMLEAFRASGQDLNALPAAVVQSDAFRHRRPIEVMQP